MTTLETMYAPQVNSPATTLSANISSSATSISVLSGSVLPAAPNLLVIGGDTDSAETVRMTAKSGNTLTVVRGVQGTAKSWTTGATIARLFTAKDLSDVQGNITALNSGKAEAADLTAAEQRIDDVYAATASGPIATFYRTVGGLPVDGLTIDITPVQAGTGDPSPTNVRAISGWTGANVFKAGKNLFDPTYFFANCGGGGRNTATVNADQSVTITETASSGVMWMGSAVVNVGSTIVSTEPTWPAKKGQTFVFKFSGLPNQEHSIIECAENGVVLARRYVTNACTIQSDDCAKIALRIQLGNATQIGKTMTGTFQLELSDTATPWEPYSGPATSISWNTEAGTVYGGTLDVTTGLLTVTHKRVDMGSIAWAYSSSGQGRFNTEVLSDIEIPPSQDYVASIISEIYPTDSPNNIYAGTVAIGINTNGRIWVHQDPQGTDANAFKTAVTGKYMVYPLAAASQTTYQLTPAQVTSLLGENNVWADTGDVYVTFGADIKSYIDDTTGGKQDKIFASGILKGDGEGGVSAAVAGTDYQAPLTAGTDYQTPLAEEKLQYYGVCSTSASTQAKTVTIDGITALTTGLEIRVKMTNAQTYNGTPTLNVNSLGAKSIMQHGSVAAVRYQWQAGEVVSLTYDGTYWVLENNSLATTTYFGLTRLSSATNSTAEDSAATPKAVKTAYDLANAAVPNSAKSAASGVATLDSNTKVTAAQASSYMFMLQENTTLTASHEGCMLVCTGNITITIPSTLAAGTEIEILNYGTGVITVTGASGVSLNGASAGSKTIPDQYTSGVLKAISASQWVIQGAIE